MGDKLAHSAETVRRRSKHSDYWGESNPTVPG